MSDFEQEYQQYHSRLNECITANKAAVFNALEAGGITSVVVRFDGVGDSGDITDVAALTGEKPVDLPQGNVETLTTQYPGPITNATQPLADALAQICLDGLESIAPGWQNNDGATGTFTLDVAKRVIALELGQQFTDVSWSSHEL